MLISQINIRFTLILCLILISACSSPPTDSALAQPTPKIIIQGLCDNALYPVKQNATWMYSVSGNGNFSYTETITSVTPHGFTLSTQFNNSTTTQEWVCETGGLKATQLGTINYLLSQPPTLEVTGVKLPKELISGMQWLYSLKLEQVTYTVMMQEMGSEEISVPAGIFNATKFQASHQFESTDNQSNFTVSSLVWYANNIGLIKFVDEVQKSDGAFTVTTELISYSIP